MSDLIRALVISSIIIAGILVAKPYLLKFEFPAPPPAPVVTAEVIEARRLERSARKTINRAAEQLAQLPEAAWLELQESCQRAERAAAATLDTNTPELRLCAAATRERRLIDAKSYIVKVEQFFKSL